MSIATGDGAAISNKAQPVSYASVREIALAGGKDELRRKSENALGKDISWPNALQSAARTTTPCASR